LAAPKARRVPWFSQEKIDPMFIGDAPDPVKRIGTGGRMPNRQTHGPAELTAENLLDALAADLRPAGSALCASGCASTRKIVDGVIILHSYDAPRA
jgi:hypothetical protein